MKNSKNPTTSLKLALETAKVVRESLRIGTDARGGILERPQRLDSHQRNFIEKNIFKILASFTT